MAGGEGVDVKRTPPTYVRKKKRCQYLRGGNCVEHGPGATKYFEPGHKLVTGPDGGLVKKYYKKTVYRCDVAPGGVNRLRQTQLTSLMTSPMSNKGGDDTQAGVGENCSNFSLSTSTAGKDAQNGHSDRQEVADEN